MTISSPFQTGIYVVSLTNVILSIRGDNCLISFKIQNDVYMKSHVFRHVETSTVYDCASECMTSSVCESFNFDTGSLTCHLNNNSSDHVEVDPRPGYLFSDIKHWDQILTGPCSTVSCNASSRCQTFRNGHTRCISEFKGCGTPPEMRNANVTNIGHSLHAEAKYACHDDFRSCSPMTGSVCQTTGNWTEIIDQCQRFKWVKPAMGFMERTPCKGRNFHSIKIAGNRIKGRLMILNLIQRNDRLLHVSFRYKHEWTVLNYQRNGRYGNEVIVRNLSLPRRRSFLLEVAQISGTFKITMDGRYYYSYKERLVGRKPDTIQIQNDVRLESVEVC